MFKKLFSAGIVIFHDSKYEQWQFGRTVRFYSLIYSDKCFIYLRGEKLLKRIHAALSAVTR